VTIPDHEYWATVKEKVKNNRIHKKKTVLSPWQRDFVSIWLKTGDPKKAYLAVRPNCAESTLKNQPYALLRSPLVQKEIQKYQDMIHNAEALHNARFTKDHLVSRLIKVADKASENEELKNEISALKEAGTVAGHYEKAEEKTADFSSFLSTITGALKEKNDVIDVESKLLVEDCDNAKTVQEQENTIEAEFIESPDDGTNEGGRKDSGADSKPLRRDPPESPSVA
jgi:uncharacterized protein (DUF488 family)